MFRSCGMCMRHSRLYVWSHKTLKGLFLEYSNLMFFAQPQRDHGVVQGDPVAEAKVPTLYSHPRNARCMDLFVDNFYDSIQTTTSHLHTTKRTDRRIFSAAPIKRTNGNKFTETSQKHNATEKAIFAFMTFSRCIHQIACLTDYHLRNTRNSC